MAATQLVLCVTFSPVDGPILIRIRIQVPRIFEDATPATY